MTLKPQSVCVCGKTFREHFKGGFCFRESHFGEHYLMNKFKPLSPARSGEPSAPQMGILQSMTKAINLDLDSNDSLTKAVKEALAAPQTSAEQYIGSDQERVFLEKKALGDFAAPQPVSGDAPKYVLCGNCSISNFIVTHGDLGLILKCNQCGEQKLIEVLAGDAPKVEEIARQIAEKLVAHHLSVWQGLEKAIELYMELIIPFLRPYFPPASQTPKNVIEAATELLDAMETCHICKGALILQEHPVHCEGCPSDCENHEGTECTPIYVLHAKLRKLLKLATPASTARTDGWPDLLYGDHEAWCGKYTRNGESNSGGNIGVWYASAVFWRNRAEGILNPSELPAAPGSVPQAPDSPNKPPCPNCGCNHFRGENTLCNDGVPQAEPPKEEKP